MVIRAYRPSDCGALAALFRSTIYAVNTKDYTRVQLDAWAAGAADLEQWHRSLAAHYSLVALEGGRITGFGDIDKTGYLDRLYVHPDFQRRGTASAICDRLEQAVSGRIVTHASITAKPFFEKRGYKAVHAQLVALRGVLLTNFIREKAA